MVEIIIIMFAQQRANPFQSSVITLILYGFAFRFRRQFKLFVIRHYPLFTVILPIAKTFLANIIILTFSFSCAISIKKNTKNQKPHPIKLFKKYRCIRYDKGKYIKSFELME